MWPLYHSFLLVQRGLHLRLLSLPTRGLVLHGRLIMYRSADRFQYLNLISDRRCSCHGNRWVGLAQLTCCSKKSLVGKISGLKTMSDMVRKTPKQLPPPPPPPPKKKKCRGKSSEKTKPALLSTCCANSFNGCKLIHEPRTVADFITNKTLLPVGTTRDWTKQPDHYKSWHETLATEVNVHAWGKNCRMAIIKKLTCRWKFACANCLRNNDIYYGAWPNSLYFCCRSKYFRTQKTYENILREYNSV